MHNACCHCIPVGGSYLLSWLSVAAILDPCTCLAIAACLPAAATLSMGLESGAFKCKVTGTV